jgi:hypothetical protein
MGIKSITNPGHTIYRKVEKDVHQHAVIGSQSLVQQSTNSYEVKVLEKQNKQ